MKNLYILPTDSSRVFKHDEDNTLHLFNVERLDIHSNQATPQNIYITNDDVPKLDEWGLNTKNNVIFKCKGFEPDEYDKTYCIKIILTTDKNLIKNGVQAIDDEFLEWFVKNPNCEHVVLGFTSIIGDSEIKRTYKVVLPKEDLSYTTKMGVEVNDEMVRKTMIPKEYFGKQGIDIKEFERKANEIIEQVGANNIIDTWLDKHGSPEIAKQVEAEAKELCEEETLDESIARGYIKVKKEIDYNEFDWTSFKLGAKWQAKRMYSKEELIEHLNHLIMLPSSELDKFTDDEEMITMKWFEQFKKK